MLVISRLRPAAQDGGSALLSVLIVMLVLTVGGLVLATVVTNTSGVLADSRSKAQSRAAADAGMAEVVASLKRGDIPCGDSDSGVAVDGEGSPEYDYRITCTEGTATIRVNAAVDGARTAVESIYAYTPEEYNGGDMVFFGTGNVTFTQEVKTSAGGRLLSIIIPMASFTCQSLIPANITAYGDIDANGGCTIGGSAISATGVLDMCCGTDVIEGDVATSGTGTSTVRGTLKGNLHTNGPVTFGWEGKEVAGSATINGNAQLGNVKIKGTLTVPSGKSITAQEGTVVGGTVRPPTAPGPTPPVMPPWFEYRFDAADWPGYQIVALTSSGSGHTSCNGFNSSPGAAWTALGTYTSPVVIDARACSTLSSNNGSSPTIQLKTNVVLLAKKFDLSGAKFKAAAGVAGKPKLWVMTEDPTPGDNKPTCSSGYGDLLVNGTQTDLTIKAMAYTPCRINVAGGAYGVQDKWNGTFYGGGWNYGGGLTFTADPIAVPGMGEEESGGTANGTLGSLLASRDVEYEVIG